MRLCFLESRESTLISALDVAMSKLLVGMLGNLYCNRGSLFYIFLSC
jgi:hypothetical protein